jgi:dimethylhistidine N-methyltransferase
MSVGSAVSTDRPGAAGDARDGFARDVRDYLARHPRQLPSRYLYDELGSCLFEAICRLPWYPIARAETRLLARHRDEILAGVDRLGRIIELGGGSGAKLATLIGGRLPVAPLHVHLIDVSAAALAVSARSLGALEGVRVSTREAPYEVGLADARSANARGGTLVLFLGSNISNFDPPADEAFLREIRAALGPGDRLLLGADLTKPEAVLQLAYDDPLGVTAAFNRNLLIRVNRELEADFDLETFAHRASWNPAASRVEMHLVSQRRQFVRIAAAGLALRLEEAETIWTESSYKYEPAALAELLQGAGFATAGQWIDEADRFALTLLRPA